MTRPRKRTVLATAALLGAFYVGTAYSGDVFPDMLTSADRDRLAIYQPLRASVIDYVRQYAKEDDLNTLERVLEGTAIDIPPEQLVGFWDCRLLRLVRLPVTPILIYQKFECEVFRGDNGLRLRKLTGSQRTAGAFHDIGETRLGYVGALTVGDEKKPVRYGEQARRNQAGYLIPVSSRRMRLEFPQPGFESDFDILELWR